MPVFEIGLEDGRKLRIEADNQDAALSGVQHFMSQSPPVTQEQPSSPAAKPETGLVAGLRHGLSNLVAGPAETLKQYAGVDNAAGDKAKEFFNTKNVQHAPVLDKNGLHVGNLPQAMAEGAPGMAADIAAARVASKIPMVGRFAALPAGVASYLLRTRGQAALERAGNRTGEENAVPNTEDKTAALATGAVEAIPQALGIGRFLPGARAASTGLRGVGEAVGNAAKTVGVTGAAGGATDLVSQIGATLGTPGGVQVDPLRSLDAGITSGVTGGLLKTPRTVADAATAIKYRGITPELEPAAARVANRVVQAAEGKLSDPEKAGVAVKRAEAGIKTELADAITDLKTRVTLDADATNAFDAVKDSNRPTKAELGHIERVVRGDPRAQNILELTRDVHALDVLKRTGVFNGDKFTGGISSGVQKVTGVNPHMALKTAGAALAVDAFGSHLIAQSPTALAVLLGTVGAARATDKLTGARSPANRFVNRFSDPSQGVRNLPDAPAAPPHKLYRDEIKQAFDLMAARRANEKLSKVAEIAESKDVRDQMKDAQDLMAARRAHLQGDIRGATDLMAARRANAKIKKANGKVKEEAAPQSDTEGYTPLTPEEMPYLGKSIGERVATELEKYSPALKKVYGQAIVKKHETLKGLLADFSGTKSLEEQAVLAELFHQLDYTKERGKARNAVEHYARVLSPETATELRSVFGPAINRIWKK